MTNNGNDKQSARSDWEEVDEEIDGGVPRVCGVAGGCDAAAGADGLHGFAGEPNGGAGTGGRCGCAVLGGAVAGEGAAQLVLGVNPTWRTAPRATKMRLVRSA